MPTYTRGDIKNRLNAGIKGKVGILVDVDETINLAVRSVLSEVDIRSTRRRTDMVPGLFADTWEYPAPADLKGQKVIALQELADEYRQEPYSLVTFNEFKQYRKVGTMAVQDHDLVRKLLISGGVDDQTQSVVASLDSLDSGGGTWGLFGDATGVSLDDGEFVRGTGSIKFNISNAGGTTAGIVNSTLDDFDHSPYQGVNDAIFVWVKIVDPTNITNFTIRYGDDATNYYGIAVTQTHFNTAFAAGWNLLRFEVNNRSTTGSPTTVANYVALFMTKDAGKISENGYKFDNIVFKSSKCQKLYYYSKYPWQDATTGAWKENSTADSDYIIADTDEYNLFLEKVIELAGDEVDEAQTSVNAQARYLNAKKRYEMDSPSEAALLTYDYQAQYYI